MHTARGNPQHVSKRALTAILLMRPAVQLGLFWEVERYAHLVTVDHPRPVYYDIWLERMVGCGFRVRKTSGIQGRKPNVRTWVFDSLSVAEKDFDRRLKAKLNPQRKASRRYVLREK